MPTSPAWTLQNDPAFQAFVASSGLADEIAMADTARRTNAINSALGINQEETADQGQQTRKNIAGSHEANGTLRSGQYLEDVGNQERSQARASALAQLNAANQVGDLQSALTSGQAGRAGEIAQTGMQRTYEQALSQGLEQVDSMTLPNSEGGSALANPVPKQVPYYVRNPKNG